MAHCEQSDLTVCELYIFFNNFWTFKYSMLVKLFLSLWLICVILHICFTNCFFELDWQKRLYDLDTKFKIFDVLEKSMQWWNHISDLLEMNFYIVTITLIKSVEEKNIIVYVYSHNSVILKEKEQTVSLKQLNDDDVKKWSWIFFVT